MRKGIWEGVSACAKVQRHERSQSCLSRRSPLWLEFKVVTRGVGAASCARVRNQDCVLQVIGRW